MSSVNLKKSLFVVFLVIVFTVSMSPVAHAAALPEVANAIEAEESAEVVEEFVEEDEIGDVEDTGEEYVDDSGDVTTTIPKDGDDFVTMENEEGDTIGMSLPEEVEAEDGVATENGTVVYQTDENVDVCVQSITDEQDGLIIDGVRELVTIKDKDAPKEYSFNFDLPAGYSLVTSEEYCERQNNALEEGEEKVEVEPGFVYVVDDEDEIQAVLDAPWAKDANGNDVATNYTIDGLTLTQHVEFDENSAFPIVADPKTEQKPKSRYVSSKDFSCNISHSVIGVGSFVAGTGYKVLKKGAKEKVIKAVAAKLGSKVIPIVSWGSWALVGYATLASAAGYNYTRISGTYEIWTYYKRQGGQWAQGYQYRNGKIKCSLVK